MAESLMIPSSILDLSTVGQTTQVLSLYANQRSNTSYLLSAWAYLDTSKFTTLVSVSGKLVYGGSVSVDVLEGGADVFFEFYIGEGNITNSDAGFSDYISLMDASYYRATFRITQDNTAFSFYHPATVLPQIHPRLTKSKIALRIRYVSNASWLKSGASNTYPHYEFTLVLK